jgi:hypothetical protein
MGSRFLAFVALILMGFALMHSTSAGARRFSRLYVSPPAFTGYRAAAGMPSAVMMTEMSEEEIANRAFLAKLDTWGPSPLSAASAMGEVPVDEDWALNPKDGRFQLLSMVPFGLVFIALSLQRAKRAEPASEMKVAPSAVSRPPIAMISVRGQGQFRSSRPRQTLAEWISM